MAIIKVIDGVFVGFYDRFQLSKDYPDKDFSLDFLKEDNPQIKDYNAYPCRVLPAPTYDPSTTIISLDKPVLQGGEWVQGWQITPLTPEQIYQRYIANLNWDGFKSALINLSPSSAYSQLQTWASTPAYNAFNTSLSNIIFALAERSEPTLKLAVGDLKAKTAPMTAPKFTTTQLAEINAGLGLLGVNWTWESL